MSPAVISVLHADPNFICAAYWDGRYPRTWADGRFLRDVLELDGYEILDADQLKTWMDDRITDAMPSVVVFCKDVVPDTVAESKSSSCTIRQYLNAGGKIVWFADIPMYYQGHSDGTTTVWGVTGSMSILGCDASGGQWDLYDQVSFTPDGIDWGLTETWQSTRPTWDSSLRSLALNNSAFLSAWVKHYIPDDTYRGFVRLFDQPGAPNFNDVRRLAEYPNVPESMVLDNQAEIDDDIIGAFFYPWYANPDTRGFWLHWDEPDYNPPTTWSAYYLPGYPDSTWNPAEQLYDSTNTELLRWQDRAMTRAGIDIAISSWWAIGNFEDSAFAKAIRVCKGVQWCIYYEMEAYSDPTSQKIYNDIKYVLDTYGPTHNYAKVDDKWLVLIYGAGGEGTAERWRQAKALLAADGYNVYLNADTYDATAATAPDPWDAVHSYMPIVYQGMTNTLPNVDDSAWIAPGFWSVPEQNPRLEYSLSEFTSAWDNILTNRQFSRFILIETWNEWHEGTQIEPGQEIIPDQSGYYPSGYNYGYDFIDTIGPAAVNDLHWQSSGHRLNVPVRMEAEEMVWEIGTSRENPWQWRISQEGARIGESVLVATHGNLMLTVNCRAVKVGPAADWPQMILYVDDIAVQQWTVQSSQYIDYSVITSITGGIHKIEIALANDPGGDMDVDLVVDFVNICTPIQADISENCFVDGVDFAMFALQWLKTGCGLCGGADLTGDGWVKMDDLVLIINNWLAGVK